VSALPHSGPQADHEAEREANARAMSFVARALVDTAFLDDSLAADSATAAGSIAPAPLDGRDLRRLKQFAGFITRVQHNFLWEAFPWTIRGLQYYGASLDTFTAYAATAQRLRRAGASQDDKINAFTAFLEQRLESATDLCCPGMSDIVRHERAIWTLRASRSRHARGTRRPEARSSAVRASSGFGRLAPAPARPFVVTSLQHDPLALIARLARNSARRQPIVSTRTLPPVQDVLYSLDDASNRVTRAAIDAASAVLLCEIDGRRSVAAILRRAARRSGIRISTGTARTVFELFADRGILYLSAPLRRTF
jgi:hypothetical protein